MTIEHGQLDALLHSCRDIAKAAGDVIMHVYNSEFAVQHKDDKSPLTEADLGSHKIIDERLKKLTPQWTVLSEEEKALPFEERKKHETYWLIDPLDGTREFVKRNDEFTVNIALIHQHETVLGVVYAPALDLGYSAARGLGAWLQKGNEAWESICCRELDENNLTLASTRSHGSEALQNFLAAIGDHEAVAMGSSLKLCVVAEGKADLYPRIGLTSEWDTAAAQCVVEEAGGHVTDIDMQPMRYNTKDSLLNPFFFVFGKTWKDWSQYLSK